MRRRVSIAVYLGWMVLLGGCAGGKLSMLGGPTTLQVSGSSSTVRLDETAQFTATTSSGPATQVQWSVNGIAGGNATLGTIDDQGRYTAPASLPANNQITIAASSSGVQGSVQIALWNPIPVISSVTSRDLGDSIELTISGRSFVPGAKVHFGGTMYAGTVHSGSQLQTTVPSSAAATGSVELAVANPDPGAAFSDTTMFSLNRPTRTSRGGTSSAAARFLTQASFGPTTTEINNINALRVSLGTTSQALSKYIDDQMNASITVPSTWPDPTPIPSLNFNGTNFLCNPSTQCVQISWFQNALQGQDQLRQRTAFALSQIWVISGNTVTLADSFVPYYRILNNRAFDNYRNIMKDVTLSSAMGFYLDMGNSAKPANGSIANENYARELLQLFTVGLYLLNDDGTFQLDGNGQRIPSYTEADVQQFARALTGWTYQRNNGTINTALTQNFSSNGTTGTNRTLPMIAVDTQHDTGSKTLLNYSGAVFPTLPGGQQATTDLDNALDNIFNHPNVPPFVCQQMIQHLVTSNPSPAYVARMTAVFKNNGSGVRGDMAAVVKAILLDPEARQADLYPTTSPDGHLKEPVLYITGILRSLGFVSNNPATYLNYDPNQPLPANPVAMTNLGANLWVRGRDMGQNVLFSPSVFNYFTPDYSILSGTLLGPEFQLQTTANAPMRLNFADLVSRNAVGNAIDVSTSMTSLTNIAGNPQALVDQLDQQFMYGQMSASMKQAIINTITPMSSNTFRARVALYLVITSSQYQVAK